MIAMKHKRKWKSGCHPRSPAKAVRGNPRQVRKAELRRIGPGEEGNRFDWGYGLPAAGAGRHSRFAE